MSAPVTIPHHECCAWCRHPVHAEVVVYNPAMANFPVEEGVRRVAALRGWEVVALEPAPEAQPMPHNLQVLTNTIIPSLPGDTFHLLVFRAAPTTPGGQP